MSSKTKILTLPKTFILGLLINKNVTIILKKWAKHIKDRNFGTC